MKRQRLISDFDLSGKVSVTDASFLNQIRNVLRMKKGDELTLCNGLGYERDFSIIASSKEEVILEPVSEKRPAYIPERKVILCLSIIKKDNFEVAAQKAVECGVSGIVPVISERTVKGNIDMERLRKIIREASEQCGRGSVPDISSPVILEEALSLSSSANIFVFHTDPDSVSKKIDGEEGKVDFIFIGPEGGFSDKEIELFRSKGAIFKSLGNLILRAETAAAVSVYLHAQGIDR